MKRLTAAGACALAFFVVAGAASDHVAVAHRAPNARPFCHHRLFTVSEDEHAARAVYRGTRAVTRRNLRMLGQLERCQRNPAAQRFVRGFNHRQAQAHDQAVWDSQHPWSYSVASWYDDAGETACAFHATYGVANLSLPCGTKVEFLYHGRKVTAVVQDRGPYAAGREWDLNQGLAAALGFDGVDTVGWRTL